MPDCLCTRYNTRVIVYVPGTWYTTWLVTVPGRYSHRSFYGRPLRSFNVHVPPGISDNDACVVAYLASRRFFLFDDSSSILDSDQKNLHFKCYNKHRFGGARGTLVTVLKLTNNDQVTYCSFRYSNHALL